MGAEQVPPGRYRHFKGPYYEVLGMARHSETEEPLVIYRPVEKPTSLWARPLAMWYEQVPHDGSLKPRFERVGD